MRKAPLALGIIFFSIAIVVFVFGGGARAIYSGIFFLVIGSVMVANSRRSKQDNSKYQLYRLANMLMFPSIKLILEVCYE